MPPLRTLSTTKPMKTERTHEENQERAYVAASRRSDRSLEARVESARRASEIHKRRTGRSLRVTEQDVINEEMYEEEDDDLPLGYRRLTAHLQTGSADFDRRLAAYLANHVAMRSALDHAIHPYGYPDASHMGPSQPHMFPSPLNTQGIAFSSQHTTPTSPRGQHPYRQTPYPMPGSPSYRLSQQQLHQRSASMSLPQGLSNSPQSFTTSPIEPPNQNSHTRRMSMPASSIVKNEASLSLSPQATRPSLSRISSDASHGGQPTINTRDDAASTSMGPPPQPYPDSSQQYGLSPLTMTLPQDSQMLLGPALDSNDPFTNMLMSGGSIQTPSFNNFGNLESLNKQAETSAAFQGMDSTLAPSALSMSPNQDNEVPATDFSVSLPPNFADMKGFEFPASQNSSNGDSSNQGVDGAWEAFIDDKSWAENAT